MTAIQHVPPAGVAARVLPFPRPVSSGVPSAVPSARQGAAQGALAACRDCGLAGLAAQVAAMRRPRLLMQAARHGLSQYRGDRHLRRIAGPGLRCGSPAALSTLIEIEGEHEILRREGSGGYSAGGHVAVLTALLAEARGVATP